MSYCQEVGHRGSLFSLASSVLYKYNDYKATHQTAERSGHQDSDLTNTVQDVLERIGSRGARNFIGGKAENRSSADDGGKPSVWLDAMRSMLVEVKKDNGRSESGSGEGSAGVRESPEGA